MQFKSSLSLYQCTLLPICTVATVQLLYAIQILTVTIPVHTVTTSPSKKPLPGTERSLLPAETPEPSPLIPSDVVEPYSRVSPCPISYPT